MENNNTNKESKNWIKAYIVDVLPCISVAFFVLAYFYNATFFSVFGIDILQYATFGDIFMTIIEPLCVFAFLAAVYMFFNFEDSKQKVEKFLDGKEFESKLSNDKSSSIMESISSKENRIIKKIKAFDNRLKKLLKPVENYLDRFFPRLLGYFLFVIIIYAVCFECYNLILESFSVTLNLSLISIGLIIPLLMFPFALAFLKGTLLGFYRDRKKSHVFNFLNTLKTNPLGYLLVVVGYYLYAASIFGMTGYKSAVSLKQNNKTTFEIKTSNGNVFNSEDYGYISHIGENTFLYKKNNKGIVVLFNENIEYSEINSTYTIMDSIYMLIKPFNKNKSDL